MSSLGGGLHKSAAVQVVYNFCVVCFAQKLNVKVSISLSSSVVARLAEGWGCGAERWGEIQPIEHVVLSCCRCLCDLDPKYSSTVWTYFEREDRAR